MAPFVTPLLYGLVHEASTGPDMIEHIITVSPEVDVVPWHRSLMPTFGEYDWQLNDMAGTGRMVVVDDVCRVDVDEVCRVDVDVDEATLTVTDTVPELPWLFESPEYVAVIVYVPATVSLYTITHEPEERVHGFDVVNDPVPDVVLIETVPVGLTPVTVAVQVVVPPAVNVGQETPVVDAALLIVTVLVP